MRPMVWAYGFTFPSMVLEVKGGLGVLRVYIHRDTQCIGILAMDVLNVLGMKLGYLC